MDYEKAYKEAMEKLRSLHDNANEISKLIDLREELEDIFPELAESEDERIRKAVIDAVETLSDSPLKVKMLLLGLKSKESRSLLRTLLKHGKICV